MTLRVQRDMLASMEPSALAIAFSPSRYRNAVVALACAFMLGEPAHAYERSHYFAPMARNDELSQSTVNTVLQDRSGLLWIGTHGGLHRFDGRELLIFRHQADRDDSLPESPITALAEAGTGAFYIGTSRNGVVRLDRDTGRFVRIVIAEAGQRERDHVTSLTVDRENRLWIGTIAGLDRLDDTGKRTLVPGMEQVEVRDLTTCRDGRVYAATGTGVYRFEGETLKAVKVGKSAGNDIESIHCAHDGAAWFASSGALYRLDGDEATPRWQPEPNLARNVRDLNEDGDGRFWLARHGIGLTVFDPRTGKANTLTHDARVAGSLPENTVRTLFVDRSGLLWVGGDLRGLSATEPGGATFGFLFDEPENREAPAGNNVRAVLADGEDAVWLGIDGQGLTHYNFSTRTFTHYPEAAAFSIDPDLPDGQDVTALTDAGDGALWIGTPAGLARFDPHARVVHHHAAAVDRDDALPDGDIRSMARSSDGSLWIGTRSGGLIHHIPQSGRFERIAIPASSSDETLWSSSVMAVHEDRNGRVWVGTFGGLLVLDRTTGKLRRVASRRTAPDGLLGGMVRSILEARDGSIWIGTHGALNQLLSDLDGEFRFRNWQISDGLANDTIYSLVDDPRGRIWASTNHGISMLDPGKGEVINFVARDGLQGPEFNGGAQARLGRERLAFGGTRGLNWLDPGKIETSHFEPPLAFTSVQVGSKRRSIDDPARFDEVRLGVEDRVLMLSFAALDFTVPERNRFRYRLLGYDDQWVELGTRNEVAFTNLGPGSYDLEVLGSNHDGQFGTNHLSAKIVVTPTWWQTTLARVLAASSVVLTVLGYGLWRRRESARLRTQHNQLKLYSDRLSLALWASRDGFWDWDVVRDEMVVSGPEEFLDGRHETVISGEVWRKQIVHPDDIARVLDAIHQHVRGERDHYEAEYRVFMNPEKIVWIMARGRATERDSNGLALRIAGTFRDVSIERERDRDRRIAQEVIRSMGEAVCVSDLQHRFVSVNAAFTRITGYADHEVIGANANLLDSDQHPPEFFQDLRKAMHQRGHWSGEIWQRRKDGEQFLAWLEINDVRDANGTRTHWVAVISDITDRKRAEQELRYLANYDTLTGLPNRTLLSERLAHALIRARRLGSLVAVLFLDLDRFKHINDSMGHAAGDRLLKSAAARIVTSVRESDTVARLGGDEFTVILEDLRNVAESERIAQKILDAFMMPLEIDGRQEVVISPSIGVSLYPEHGQLPTDLLKHADTAMYHAKERGRNTFQVYEDAMDARVRQRAGLASQLQRALERKELSLVFQPKLALETGCITGSEALLRWNHPQFGQVSPGAFIPIAEETGLIVPIGEWVLHEACRQIGRLNDAGLSSHTIAVNVSALQLFRGDLVRRLRDILADTHVPAHRLELELTESMLMANPEQSIATLTQIKALGVHLSVDDFGTGYSSLAYLKRLPIDTLKIDQTFVGDLTTDPDDEAIVSTVIMMAHSLGLDVVAEGVETRDQLRYLYEQKCDEVQGNLISLPLDAARFLPFLLEHRERFRLPDGEVAPGTVAG